MALDRELRPLDSTELPASFPKKLDPLQSEAVIAEGDYRGQVVDTSLMRPLVLVKDPKIYRALRVDSKRELLVYNFVHNGKHWFAKIPKDSVIGARVEKSAFNEQPNPAEIQDTPLAHQQTVFVFNPNFPVKLLIDQTDLNGTEVTLENLTTDASLAALTEKAGQLHHIIYEITVSFEAFYPVDWEGNFFSTDVVEQDLPSGIRVGSASQREAEMKESRPFDLTLEKTLHSFEIILPEYMRASMTMGSFLSLALSKHLEGASNYGLGNAFLADGRTLAGQGWAYDLLRNSCTTWMHQTWGSVLPHNYQLTDDAVGDHLSGADTMTSRYPFEALFGEPIRMASQAGGEERVRGYLTLRFGEELANSIVDLGVAYTETTAPGDYALALRPFLNVNAAISMPSFVRDVFYLRGLTARRR